MADQQLQRARLSSRSPLTGLRLGDGFGHTSPAGIAIRRIDSQPAISIAAWPRHADALRHRLRQNLGMILPEPRKYARTTGAEVLWTGPLRWLILANEPGMDITLRDLSGTDAAVVDLSGALVPLTLEGPLVRKALGKMLPIDMHARAFSPGDARSTTAGHIGIQIICVADTPLYKLLIPRSTALDFTRWLLTSSAEFGVTLE